jgi:hypothetical protein
MAISRLPDNHEIAHVDTSMLAPCKFSEKSDIALQIAAHLRRTLEAYGNGNPPSLRLPSAMVLAGFYRRSILDVLDGLFELKHQHYEYVMNGLDGEIILHDPLARRKTARKGPGWSALSEEFLRPWNTVMAYTRNPLTDITPRKAV